MEIRDYPQAIADKELEILRIERHLAIDRRAQEQSIATIDAQIAFDERLTTDAQRTARKTQLVGQLDWHESLTERIDRYESDIKALGIELGLLRNQFSIERLLLRQKVAAAEQGSQCVLRASREQRIDDILSDITSCGVAAASDEPLTAGERYMVGCDG